MRDALASNAGDRYHFVYTARRMLDMLYPRNDLQLIEMENVVKEDLILADQQETFVGVDLTEYYGGHDHNSARKIVIVQVKYSSINPNSNWTLARLCTDKISSQGNPKPGTSIIKKLSNDFANFYQRFGDTTSKKIKIKIHSNQSLKDNLETHLLQAQSLILGKNDLNASKLLQKTEGDLSRVLNRIKKTTKLSWKRFAAFLKCWDLSGFAQKMLSAAEAELFISANQFQSNVDINHLIGFVQEHAIPKRKTRITRDNVYAQLRLREIDFFPAPTNFSHIKGLQFTKNAECLMEAINKQEKGILLVHGVSGTGKSTSIQLIGQNYGNGNSIVIYDCFAGGEGLQPGSERFPYNKCFVQIINEIDAIFHTNILATTKLDYEYLMSQFRKTLGKAAQLAKNHGQRLVISIDAIDNAIDAAACAPIRSSELFIPFLWKIEIPDNCLIIVATRTENIPNLKIDCDYQKIEIKGFTKKETENYLRSFWSDTKENTVDYGYIYNRTRGNPRVLWNLIDGVEHESPSDISSFVDTVTRENAFEYYKTECPKRLKTKADKLILGVLLEAKGSISINTLSDIIQRPLEEIQAIIERLYFGLRISDGNIFWKDQDFLDFTKSYVCNEIKEAQSLLADYCKSNFKNNSYAK
jgi:hypothetical protein